MLILKRVINTLAHFKEKKGGMKSFKSSRREALMDWTWVKLYNYLLKILTINILADLVLMFLMMT